MTTGSRTAECVISDYSFRSALLEDLPIVQRWLDAPAVRTWWVDAAGKPSELIDAEDLADPNVAMWIVSYRDRPFAFMQDYDPHAYPGHHFAHLPAGSRGIDQFIGEPDMLDRGHGSGFIRVRTDWLLANGVPAIGTDPHPATARAIRAYEKAGFRRSDERETAWGY